MTDTKTIHTATMPTKPTIDPTIAAITTAATAVYGSRWKAPLAAAAGISHTTVNKVVSGERPLTPAVAEALGHALQAEFERMGARAAALQAALKALRAVR